MEEEKVSENTVSEEPNKYGDPIYIWKGHSYTNRKGQGELSQQLISLHKSDDLSYDKRDGCIHLHFYDKSHLSYKLITYGVSEIEGRGNTWNVTTNPIRNELL